MRWGKCFGRVLSTTGGSAAPTAATPADIAVRTSRQDRKDVVEKVRMVPAGCAGASIARETENAKEKAPRVWAGLPPAEVRWNDAPPTDFRAPFSGGVDGVDLMFGDARLRASRRGGLIDGLSPKSFTRGNETSGFLDCCRRRFR